MTEKRTLIEHASVEVRAYARAQKPPQPPEQIARDGVVTWTRMELHMAAKGWHLCRTCRYTEACAIRDEVLACTRPGVEAPIVSCPSYEEA